MINEDRIIPEDVDLSEVLKCLEYLEGYERLMMIRSGIKKVEYKFDVSNYRKLKKWMKQKTDD